MKEALGQPDTAEVEAGVEAKAVQPADGELGRAATDVQHQRLVCKLARERDTPEGQPGLVLAGEQSRLEAVAPLDLAEEGLAVLCVADGAGGDRQSALGAERLGLAAEVREDIADARDRSGEQALALVDALAEACDLEASNDLGQATVLHVGDEESRRVRAEIDGGNSHVREASRVRPLRGAPGSGRRPGPAKALRRTRSESAR